MVILSFTPLPKVNSINENCTAPCKQLPMERKTKRVDERAPKNQLQQMQSSRINLKLSLLPWTWLTCHWTKSTADSKGEGSSRCLFHLCGHSQFWKGNRGGDIRRNWLQNTNLKLISPRTKAVHKYSRILCFQWPKVTKSISSPPWMGG